MRIELNGDPQYVEPGTTVADAVGLAGAGEERRGVAAAIAGEVVPRADWDSRELAEGDEVEVVRAVQGG